MHFILDENVPMAVADMLVRNGHVAESIRDYVLPGSPDPLVATVSEALNAILITFDGDFRHIAPRVPKGQRTRFKTLSRIWMRCDEPDAADRLESGLSLVEFEFDLAEQSADRRMIMSIGTSFIRTDR